jgi:hypothetical protein
MVARGFDMIDQLEGPLLDGRNRQRTLSSLGLLPGEVVTVHAPRACRHFELGQPPPRRHRATAKAAVAG